MREWNYLQRRRSYQNMETGEASLNLIDVLPKRLTLCNHYIHDKKSYSLRWGQRFTNDTLFNEVQLVPPGIEVTEEDLDPYGTRTVDDLMDVYSKVVEEDWQPERFHLVMHSSGYDSRLLSAVVRKLYKKNGKDWLGTVLFLCIKWEASEFKRIMKFEGWKPSQYLVWNEAASEQEYYANTLSDFRGAWRRLGGVARIPVNMFWGPIENLQHRGVIPGKSDPVIWNAFAAQNIVGEITIWHAQYSNTVIDFLCRGGVRPFNDMWNLFYYHNIRVRPFKCAPDDEFTPWLHKDLIRISGGLPKGIAGTDKESTIFRKMLCDTVMPGLSEFRNIHALGDERRRISERLTKIIRSAYLKSWYGREVAPGVAGNSKNYNTQFSDWWEHWTSASLCEHLRKEGYEISG